MSLPRYGKVLPEHVVDSPGWKGATVEGPVRHRFEGDANDGVDAWRISKGAAVAYLRVEQPARDPFVVTVESDTHAQRITMNSASAAKEKLRELMRAFADAQQPTATSLIRGSISHDGDSQHFYWNRHRNQLRAA